MKAGINRTPRCKIPREACNIESRAGIKILFSVLRTLCIGELYAYQASLAPTYINSACPAICDDVEMLTRVLPSRLLGSTTIASQRSLLLIYRPTITSSLGINSVKKVNMATFKVPKVENEPNVCVISLPIWGQL